MARNQTQQNKADSQLAKAGWVDEGDGTYVLGPKPFNSELSEQVLFKVSKSTGDTEVYKVARVTSERSLLASINATTGKITSNKENFAKFYNNDKAAHKLLIDTAKAETSKNVVYMIEPETAVILSSTTSSPFKGGLNVPDINEQPDTPLNPSNPFEVVDLSSTTSAGDADEEGNNGEETSSDETTPKQVQPTRSQDNQNTGGGPGPDVTKTGNQPAPDAGDANDGGGPLPQGQDGDDASNLSSEARTSLSRTDNGVKAFAGGTGKLQYPEKMNGDRIRFEIKDYQKSGLGDTAGYGIGAASRRPAPTLGTIYLPIQKGYGDTLSCNWGEGEINPLTAMAASASYSTIMTAAQTGDLGQAAGNFFSKISEGANTIMGSEGNEELKLMAASYFAAQAVGMQGFLSRTAGAAINNNLELLFQGPTLRSFNLQFRLTPRSQNETNSIKKIIRAFKINMVPEASQSNLFLNAPRIFDIAYLTTVGGGETLHPYMNRFKRCALKDFSVNYSPDGQYMTYKDAGMTAYELSMTFAELDPVLANDYKGIDATDEGMGY